MAEDKHRDVEREFLAAWNVYAAAVVAHEAAWHRWISQAAGGSSASSRRSMTKSGRPTTIAKTLKLASMTGPRPTRAFSRQKKATNQTGAV